MAAKVTALKLQKKNRERVNVFLDDRFAFGLPAIVAATLKLGQDLSDAEIETLKKQGAIESAYGKTLNYLSYRPRSQAEVETYLQRRGVPEHQMEEIVARLQRASLLDDIAFAQYWVENRERFRPRGLRALRHELRVKGLADDIIEQALAELDAASSAYRASTKKAQQLSQADESTFQRKVVEYLARRGFDYEVARQAAERHWQELDIDE